jgi:hypothetical protein
MSDKHHQSSHHSNLNGHSVGATAAVCCCMRPASSNLTKTSPAQYIVSISPCRCFFSVTLSGVRSFCFYSGPRFFYALALSLLLLSKRTFCPSSCQLTHICSSTSSLVSVRSTARCRLGFIFSTSHHSFRSPACTQGTLVLASHASSSNSPTAAFSLYLTPLESPP